MALLPANKVFVGACRRADEPLGKRDSWYPQSYVSVDLDGHRINLSPTGAKALSKALKAAADIIEPPVRRRRA